MPSLSSSSTSSDNGSKSHKSSHEASTSTSSSSSSSSSSPTANVKQKRESTLQSKKSTKPTSYIHDVSQRRCTNHGGDVSSTLSPYKPIGDCCNRPPPPPPRIYRPDRGCYEVVKGPFKNPIPTPYQRYLDKFKKKCCPTTRTAIPTYCCPPRNAGCCEDARDFKTCRAELERLRAERWKEQERKCILEEKRRQEWMEQQYQTQLNEWDRAQAKCARDMERRKALLRQILCHRKEMKKLKEEARQWRHHQQNLMLQQQKEQEEIWVKEFTQREDERRWEQEKLKMHQEDKLLEVQMKSRCSKEMAVPELEELRRMFVPVEQGPKETFEYFVLEPRPGEEQIRKEAEQKMQALMGLRDTHGIHLDLSDRAKKKTTIQLAMGPKLSSGEREQSCKILSTPGAFCSNCNGDVSTAPNVVIPECLKPLMQTLSYRVNEIDTPLLTLKTFGCGESDDDYDGANSNGKEVPLESGPNFNGTRLYGTIVLPKGTALSPFYTQPYNITF